jgi:hypothetical protein
MGGKLPQSNAINADEELAVVPARFSIVAKTAR